jgi:membrane-associated protein
MNIISELLLANLTIYGAPLFGLAILLGSAGFPIPLSLIVVAAGAFSRQGTLNWYYAAGLGLAGAVIGDSIGFALGRWGGKRVFKRFGNSDLLVNAQSTFNRGSGPAIFLTRFLLTTFAVPINLIAGSSCRFRNFLIYDFFGEAAWIILYGGLGYLFGSQWELISNIMGDFGVLALVLVVLAGGSYFLLQKRNSLSALKPQFVKIPVVQSN